MAQLKPVHWSKVEKVLLHLGYTFSRQKGSHRVYVKEGQLKHVTVPKHKAPIPRGTLKSILRNMDISNDKFQELLREVEN